MHRLALRAPVALIVAAALAALAGCVSMPTGAFENRVSCTLDRQQGQVCSFWGPLCVGSKIAESDAKVMCRKDAPAAPAASAPSAAAASGVAR